MCIPSLDERLDAFVPVINQSDVAEESTAMKPSLMRNPTTIQGGLPATVTHGLNLALR